MTDRRLPKTYPTGDDTNWRLHVDEEFVEFRGQLNDTRIQLAENTVQTAATLKLAQATDERTKELVDIFSAGKLVAFVFKWCAIVGAACVAIWVAVRGAK